MTVVYDNRSTPMVDMKSQPLNVCRKSFLSHFLPPLQSTPSPGSRSHLKDMPESTYRNNPFLSFLSLHVASSCLEYCFGSKMILFLQMVRGYRGSSSDLEFHFKYNHEFICKVNPFSISLLSLQVVSYDNFTPLQRVLGPFLGSWVSHSEDIYEAAYKLS